MPLPFKHENPQLPNNKTTAMRRPQGLKLRLQNDDSMHRQEYVRFIENIIQQGHAELVPQNDVGQCGKVWYIPHHGVFYKAKPGKLCVVFDCSSRYQGRSLNKLLLQ